MNEVEQTRSARSDSWQQRTPLLQIWILRQLGKGKEKERGPCFVIHLKVSALPGYNIRRVEALQLFRRLHSCHSFAALSSEWLDRDAGRVLGGMNGCAISVLEGLSGAKSFETPRTPIVEKQGVDKGLKSITLGSAALPHGR
jgi:hypothetical protein